MLRQAEKSRSLIPPLIRGCRSWKNLSPLWPIVLAIMLFFGGWLFLSVRACVQLIYGRGNRRRDEASESPSPGPRVSRNVDVHVQAINSGGDDIEQEETSVVEERVEFLSASPRNKPSSHKKPIERLTF